MFKNWSTAVLKLYRWPFGSIFTCNNQTQFQEKEKFKNQGTVEYTVIRLIKWVKQHCK